MDKNVNITDTIRSKLKDCNRTDCPRPKNYIPGARWKNEDNNKKKDDNNDSDKENTATRGKKCWIGSDAPLARCFVGRDPLRTPPCAFAMEVYS